MAKKTFPYLPAQLIKSSQGWYIKFRQTNPETGERVLFRWTYDLNRIKDKRLRKREATKLIVDINNMLPDGYPFTDPDAPAKMVTTVSEALAIAEAIKCDSDRYYTVKDYKSTCKIFLSWASKKEYDEIPILEFSRGKALEFLDYVKFKRKCSNRTYNNYLIRVKALFYTLVEREYLNKNPFKGIKPKRNETKKRRVFTAEEQQVVANYIQQHEYWLYTALLLQFYCYIRPIELTRLKFKYFNLEKGLIDLPAQITKSKKRRVVTIPLIAIPHFLDERFAQNPLNYLLFGDHLKPAYKSRVGEKAIYDRLYRLHKKIIALLEETGKIEDATGLTWYSWKDTGMTNSDASLYADMRQAGHQDPKITMIYKQDAFNINEEMRTTSKEILSGRE